MILTPLYYVFEQINWPSRLPRKAKQCRNEFESGGRAPRSGAECRNFFLVVPLHFFGSKIQLVVLVSAFVAVSTHWSLSYYLLFFYSRCLPSPRAHAAICVPVPYGFGPTKAKYNYSRYESGYTITCIGLQGGQKLSHYTNLSKIVLNFANITK